MCVLAFRNIILEIHWDFSFKLYPPLFQAFSEGFLDLLYKLNESLKAIPLLGNDPVFHPFTRPVLYGKLVEVYRRYAKYRTSQIRSISTKMLW